MRNVSMLRVLLLGAVLTWPGLGLCDWQTFNSSGGLAGDIVYSIVEDRSGNYWFLTSPDEFRGGGGGVSRFDGVRWRTFTTADGLADNSVGTIALDRSGNLWFGTPNGASRFDGVTWKTYRASDGLADNSVGRIVLDRSGNLWFGTPSGASRYDGLSWKTYTTADGLVNDAVNAIAADSSGNLWFGTPTGVSRFDGVSWRTYTKTDGLAGDAIGQMFVDHSGTLWFGTLGGVSRYDGLTWKAYTTADGLASNTPTSIAEDRAGNLWFGSFDSGVTRFDGASWKTYTTADGLPDDFVFELLADRSGNLWVGGLSGISRFDGVKWRVYNTTVNLVTSMYQDRRGNIWSGIRLGGVSRFDGVSWKTYTIADGLAGSNVVSMSEDRSGNVWFGCLRSGVSRFDGVSWKTITTSDGLPANDVGPMFHDHSGNLWVGTSGGVGRYDGVGWKTFTTADGLASDPISSIAEDHLGHLWFGTDHGASLYIEGLGWGTYTTGDGLADNQVRSILCDHSGDLWFTTDVGVSRFDNIDNWTTYTSADGLAYSGVGSMAEDHASNLWFSTFGFGLSRYDGANWRTYTTADGLPSNIVYSILADRSGNEWVGTFTNGVGRFDGLNWKTFTSPDGQLKSVTVMLEDHSGSLWFGSWPNGIIRYDPDRIPPKTVFLNVPGPVTGSRDLSAAFVAAFGEANGIEYSYRLDGGLWSEWALSGSWSVGGISDGPHMLEGRSRDFSGNVDPFPALATFTVDATPPSPSLSSPAFGQAVQATTPIGGTTADSRFLADSIWVRPAGTVSWSPPTATLLAHSSIPVTNGILAAWDTSQFPDGTYDLRLAVTDSLGLTGTALASVIVDNHAPFSNVTTPVKVAAATGGDVFTTNAETHLYFAPHAFAEDAIVMVAPSGAGSVPATLPSGALKVLDGYDITWAGSLKKPARFTMSYAGTTLHAGTLALYHSTDGTNWERLGGTLDAAKKSLSLAISLPGRYALFVDNGLGTGAASLSGIAFTPRVFSPSGGFADQEVGISFRLGRAAPVTVKVYSRSGRLIREVVTGEALGAGENLIRWDGRDRNGGIVVDGMYLVTVEALGHTETKTLAVVR